MGWAYNTLGDPPNDAATILAVAFSFIAISLIIVLLRWYVRVRIVKAPGWDDVLIIIGWVGACGYTTATFAQTKWGLGLRQIGDMPPQNLYGFQLCQYVGAPFYVLGIYGFKMSLLLSYLRFVPWPYDLAARAMIIIISFAHVGFLCGFLFLCDPIPKQWDPKITWGHCINGLPFYMAFSSLTIIFDVIIMAIPFPVLITSKIQTRRRIALLALFALGIFVTIIQIIRIQTIKNLVNYLDSSTSILWSIVEANIGIIITCVPTLAPLVRYYSDRGGSGTGQGQPGAKRYAMQSWRSREGAMRHRFGDEEEDYSEGSGSRNSSLRKGREGVDDSTDDILSVSRHQGFIVKTTDVIVKHEAISLSHSDKDSL